MERKNNIYITKIAIYLICIMCSIPTLAFPHQYMYHHNSPHYSNYIPRVVRAAPNYLPRPVYYQPMAARNVTRQMSREEYRHLWEGSYLGFLADLGQSNAKLICDKKSFDFSNSDISFGLFGGVNLQDDFAVYGIEGNVLFPVTKQDAYGVDLNKWVTGDMRLRAGVAFGDWLPFVFFGIGGDYTSISTFKKSENVEHKIDFKYVYGLGLDINITQNLFARIEGYGTHIAPQNESIQKGSLEYKNGYYSIRVGLARRF